MNNSETIANEHVWVFVCVIHTECEYDNCCRLCLNHFGYVYVCRIKHML